jgi:hypothetical protein
MGYLICEKCGGYYELQKGESLSDFDCCQCGGKLEYYEGSLQEKILDNNPLKYNHKLKTKDEIKKIIDYNIDSNNNAELKKCRSCGRLNHSESRFCSKCDKSLLSLKEKKELNNQYLQENEYLQENKNSQNNTRNDLNREMSREGLQTFTSKLGADWFSFSPSTYIYGFGILFLIAIPIVSYKLGTNILILTPLFVFSLILFISLMFNESNELDDVIVETVFFTFVFAIPGSIFILIPLSNRFGYIIAFILYMGSTLAILAAQLTSIIIKNYTLHE